MLTWIYSLAPGDEEDEEKTQSKRSLLPHPAGNWERGESSSWTVAQDILSVKEEN